MFGSDLLGVGIGLIVLYLLLTVASGAAVTPILAPATAAPNAMAAAAAPTPVSCDSASTSTECRVETAVAQVRALGLPLSWDTHDPREVPISVRDWAIKVSGLRLTAVAVTLGAPFWFDLLNKAIMARGALKPGGG